MKQITKLDRREQWLTPGLYGKNFSSRRMDYGANDSEAGSQTMRNRLS
ncbi:MAG: hypothetical protein ACTHNG_09175 [Ginsengibacter sp.]